MVSCLWWAVVHNQRFQRSSDHPTGGTGADRASNTTAAIARNHYHNKGSHFLDFEILEPSDPAGAWEIWQHHLTYPKRARSRADEVGKEEERFDVRRMLDQIHNYPKTLEDLGINQTAI